MSKLAKSIDAVLTGYAVSYPNKMRYTEVSCMQQADPMTSGLEVNLQTKLSCVKYIQDQIWANNTSRENALRDIKRAMIEEVFGEFRPLIIETKAAIYDRDLSRLERLLTELHNQMFEDGL